MTIKTTCCLVVMAFWAGVSGCQQPEKLLSPMPLNPIVFSAPDTRGHYQIYSVNPDGTNKRQHTTQGNNVTPSWTPNKKSVLYASDRSGSREIYFLNADGYEGSMLKTGVVGHKLTPTMSHDLSKIAFAAEIYRTSPPEIWVVRSDGTDARRLTDTPKAAKGPTWSLFPRFSQDDRTILYASTFGGSSQIWIMNVDGSNKRQLTSGLAENAPDANAPNWSPDGKQIVLWAGYETRFGEIWVMNADGTNPTRLTHQSAPISSDNPAWSMDGRQIIFDTSRSGGGVEIWIMDADGSRQRKLIGELGSRGGVMQMSWR